MPTTPGLRDADTYTSIQRLVRVDLIKREQFGWRKYGRPMLPFDGRDSLMDAYEEALDLCVYLRKMLEERDLREAESGTPQPLVVGEYTVEDCTPGCNECAAQEERTTKEPKREWRR